MKQLLSTAAACLLTLTLCGAGFYLWTMHSYHSCHFELSQQIDQLGPESGLGFWLQMLEEDAPEQLNKLLALRERREQCRQYYWQH